MENIKHIQIAITESEYNRLKRDAERRGLKIQSYIKMVLLPPEIIAINEIDRLNQIHIHNPKMSYSELGKKAFIDKRLNWMQVYHILNKPKRDSKGRILKRVDNETNNNTGTA
jgi:hypothetical protein